MANNFSIIKRSHFQFFLKQLENICAKFMDEVRENEFIEWMIYIAFGLLRSKWTFKLTAFFDGNFNTRVLVHGLFTSICCGNAPVLYFFFLSQSYFHLSFNNIAPELFDRKVLFCHWMQKNKKKISEKMFVCTKKMQDV